MRVSCPSCQTEYDVPDAALAGRTRKLRCVSCGTLWEAGPVAVAGEEKAPTPAELAYLQRPRAAPAAPAAIGYGGGMPEAAAYRQPDVARDYGPPAVVSRPMALPPRPDPAEARHQADRESFAALLEASRQAGNQHVDVGGRGAKEPGQGGANPWLISILILLLAGGLVYLERDHIMAVWPPSIRFFAALGLK